MRELSLNILDIAQNSISAEADLIKLSVSESLDGVLTVTIEDNGKGMSEEQLEKVRDPFFTTRTTRKVGMGIPLYRMAAEMTGGGLEISSCLGVGTKVETTFVLSHLDCPPLGDMSDTVLTLVRYNPGIDFVYSRQLGEKSFVFDTREIKEVLEGVPLDNPDVVEWMKANLSEMDSELLGEPSEI